MEISSQKYLTFKAKYGKIWKKSVKDVDERADKDKEKERIQR